MNDSKRKIGTEILMKIANTCNKHMHRPIYHMNIYIYIYICPYIYIYVYGYMSHTTNMISTYTYIYIHTIGDVSSIDGCRSITRLHVAVINREEKVDPSQDFRV